MKPARRLMAAIKRRIGARPGAAPVDPPGQALLEQARAHASDSAAVAAICRRAMAEAPDDVWRLFEIGSVARDAGLTEIAEAVYGHILRRNPDTGYAAIHQAKLLAARGDAERAIAVLEAVRTPSIFDDYINAELAERLFVTGRRDRARARASRIADPGLRRETLAREDYRAFLAAHPPGEVLAAVEALERRPGYLNAEAVERRIRTALDDREGFSLVRIGDGEGAFLRLCDDDEASYPHLYARNRIDRARVWFADELDIDASGFSLEMAGISEVMRNATVLALPYAGWIENEQREGSMTGVSSLTNIVRWAADLPEDRPVTFQVINLHLELEGRLAALIQTVDELGLIACHPELPERLQRRFGLRAVEFHKLPGEKGMRELIGEAAAAGVHYPDVFRRVLAALDRPLDGKLFLVAGGVLGKFYCERIRASGGVALDIGAVADAWVGAVTRPSHDASRVL